ncbi:MAG: hypothetical protein ACRERD_15600 [Candidatus Binatia bacterium]
MTCKYILAGSLLVVACVTVALADDRVETSPAPEERGGVLDAVRTVVYLPFKGAVCGVGALTSFPAYLLSGLDSQVKADTAALRGAYCSRHYLLSPEWTK